MPFVYRKKIKTDDATKHLASIVEHFPYPICMVDPKDYKIVFANNVASERFNIVKNDKYCRIFNCDYSLCEKKECPLNLCIKNNRCVTVESSCISNKKNLFYRICAFPLLNSRKEIVYIIVYILDITDHKKVLDDLKRSKEIFESVFNNALDAICLKDRNMRYTYINSAAEKLLGKPMSEVIGKKDSDIFPKDEAKQMEIMDKRVLEGEIIKEELATEINKKLSFFYIVKVPIKDSQNKVNNICCFAHDITKIKEIEMSLKRERDLARKYLDIAGTMIIVLSLDHRVVLINKKGCEILEYNEEEIVGENWFDLFVPDYVAKKIKKKFNRFIAGKENFKNCECLVITKSGKKKIISWNNILIKDESGRVEGVLCSGEDITLRKKSEEELKKRNKELERFNKLMVGRELKMIELKNEIKKLKQKIKEIELKNK